MTVGESVDVGDEHRGPSVFFAWLSGHPVTDVKGRMMAFSVRHEFLTCLAAGVAAVAMVWLLTWFLIFSGLNEPVQFIYGSF